MGWAVTLSSTSATRSPTQAFQSPDTPGVQFHDIFTRFLNGSGSINSVINGTGAAINSTSPGPSDVVRLIPDHKDRGRLTPLLE